MKIGVMQGRLSPIVNNKIQAFPKKNWKSEFKKANSLNIHIIEWTIDHKEFEKNPIFSSSKIKELSHLKKKYKIKTPSITCDCFMQKPFWKIKNNKKSFQNFLKLINSCAINGIRYIVIPLVDNGKIENKKQLNKLKKLLFEKIKIIKKNNLKIIFEIDKKPNEVLNFIKLFPRKFFGINYDLGNSASKGYNIKEEFKLYGKYIDNIHIKDRRLGGSTVRLGLGNADFPEFYKQVRKINYKGNLIMQTARSKINQDKKEILINMLFLKKNKIINKL